jgi:membrane protease YdiL (CAAX protease family)
MEKTVQNNKLIITSLLTILIGVPALNILNTFSPYSTKLWFENNLNYYNFFWLSVFFIQLTGLIGTMLLIKLNKFNFKDFGFKLNTKQTLWFALIILMFFIIAIIFVEILYKQNYTLSCFIPDSFDKRLIYGLSLLNAGIAEEFIFRAFGITMLKKLKVNTILAILISTLFFTLIHGMSVLVFANFIQYFLFGLLMSVIFVWRKNILWCMIIHILYNFFTLYYCFIF